MTVSNTKYIVTELEEVTEGEEIGIGVGGLVQNGTVKSIDGDCITVEPSSQFIENDITITAHYIGDDEKPHYETDADDYVVTATLDNEERDVEAFINWDRDLSAPEATIAELPPDDAEEIREELDAALDQLAAARTEIVTMQHVYTRFIEGDIPLQKVIRRITECELKNGGTLALDQGFK